METKDLSKEIKELKKEIAKLLEAFNKKTALKIDSAGAEAIYAQESINGERVLLNYEVGISIQL